MRRFLKRTRLSFRRVRPSRRPNIDEEEVTDFLLNFHVSLAIFGRVALVNFDESNWKLVMTADRTVAERGAESVKRYINGNIKASFTFFASILANGTKLPLILIARGRTKRCREQFGNLPQSGQKVWHSANGWCTELLMLRYLRWLRRQVTAPEIGLLLDQFGAHDTSEVRREADSLGIHLIFIPKGATGRFQPLDRTTFGALKAKGRAKWVRAYETQPGLVCTRELGARLLLESWNELTDACVMAGWDLQDETSDDDSSSDESDEDWSLDVSDEPDDSDDDMGEEEGAPSSDDEVVEDPESRYGYGVF
jgi:hypothetical protein